MNVNVNVNGNGNKDPSRPEGFRGLGVGLGAARFRLRDYQLDAVEGLRSSIRAGNKRVLLYAPTGSGKTLMATEVIRGAVEKGNRAVFVCHRRELVHQASDKLSRIGVSHGLILAGEAASELDRVQVASIQTLHARAIRRDLIELPPAEVVVLDEAHHAISKTWSDLVALYPDAVVIGLTATPVRGDGAGLGHIFEDMVMAPGINELTDSGYLVPVRYFAPSIPDLWGVKVRAGDYVQKELGVVMDKPKLVGDIVANWSRICPDRRTVVFASSVKHSLHITEQFRDAGFSAAHIDGDTPAEERDAILRDLSEGRVQVVSNCMVLTEGWDCPSVSCAVLARPTKCLGLYLQMAGRVLRPDDGKTDTVLIDHSGAVYEHGFLSDEFPWELSTDGKIQDRQAQARKGEPRKLTCERCANVYSGQLACPACGFVPERRGDYLSTAEGTLGEVGEKPAKRREFSMSEKREAYQMLEHIRLERGYKQGWTANQYRKRFDVWPRGMEQLGPIPPSIEVQRFVKHQQIKYAKRRNSELRTE